MVASRQIAIPLDTTRSLEGRLTERGPRAAIVAPPHPLYGGSIGNPVVRALERALGERDYTTLAFNFRGIGESDGDPSGETADALEDTLAAIRALPGRLCWATGYSFGAIAALRAAGTCDDEVGCLMVAPPAAMIGPEHLERDFRRVVIAGSEDELAPEAWLREAFGEASVELRFLPGVEHYFWGAGAVMLLDALSELAL